ncbi:MAG: ABC transporter permease [Candidatus Zixiibacteriota bacterium]|nr:MAG: ABC transporter permease [candidate division Zixibacteria bacterium]
MYVKLAVRNIFRNKRRTFIAGSAIGIGLAALIWTDALIIGMETNMLASATESFLGDGQIHQESFRQSFAVEKTIVNSAELVRRLAEEEVVAHFSPRAVSFAMISSPANVSSVTMVGIDPTSERHLSQIDEAIIDGEYFGGDNVRDVIIGSKLAEILEVDMGDRIVLTVAQAHSGDLSQEMFRVSGIYHFNAQEMDRGMAFVRLNVAQKMLGLGDDFHEIALSFRNHELGRDKTDPFWQRYSQDGNEAVGWAVLLPELELAFEYSQFTTFFVGLILFGVVALGIINTLFMSLHERMFEFGVLRAVGTRAFGMARLILLEAAALSVLSIVFGSLLGFAITFATAQLGIDYTGIEFSGVTFRELLYPELKIAQFVIYPLSVFVFTVLVGLYPATFAARMSPAKAMRRTL